MRLLFFIFFFISITCEAQQANTLEFVLKNKREVDKLLYKRVVKYREELIQITQVGKETKNSLPVLLTIAEIDSVRNTPIYTFSNNLVNSDILAMYVQSRGKSMILLNPEIINYDDDAFSDIIEHEYIHQIDILLGARNSPNDNTSFSKKNNFSKSLLRNEPFNIDSYISQADDFITLTSKLHSTNFADFYKNLFLVRNDVKYIVSNIWDRNDYYTSDMEVFTRYIMLKKWLYTHNQIASIYEPISKANIYYIIAYFPSIHSKSDCFDNNIMLQNFYPILFFMNYGNML